MNGNSSRGFSFKLAMVRMPVDGYRRLMTINNLRQPGAAQVRPDFRWFALDSFSNGSVVSHNHGFLRAQHGECAFQLHGFVNGSLNKSFDLFLPECRQHAAPKTSHEALGAGKAYAISLIAAAIQHLDALRGHHLD